MHRGSPRNLRNPVVSDVEAVRGKPLTKLQARSIRVLVDRERNTKTYHRYRRLRETQAGETDRRMA
jgi:hypothetical protein